MTMSQETVLNPDSEGGKQLAIVEVLGSGFFKTTILRLAKIEINSVLAGRENLENLMRQLI
jgi:hypothetical protein